MQPGQMLLRVLLLLRFVLLLCWFELLGCAPVVQATRPPVSDPALVVKPAPRLPVAPALAVRLRPDEEKVAVELRARGIGERRWTLPALVGVELEGLVIEDDSKNMSFKQWREGHALEIQLAREPVGALQIRYVIRPTWDGATAQEVPRVLLLRPGAAQMLAASEQLLLLPASPAHVALELAVDGAAAVSTLGLEVPPRVRLADLRHAAILVGAPGRASFRGLEGEDDFAWLGETRFDLRWSVAETAGVRTAVDAYFGAEPTDTPRFTGLFMVDRDLQEDGAVVVPRGGGLYVALAAGTQWNAPVRLTIAQGLVHRWLGGRLRLREQEGDPPEAGAWFSEGVARFVAREVLWSLGTLGSDDYAAEINAHQAELATAPLRRAGNLEVAKAAAAGDRSAQALLIARGVMLATRLDAVIRSRHAGERSLQGLLRELVAQARRDNARELPLSAFTEKLAAAVDADEVAKLHAVLAGAVPAVPDAALGACFSRSTRTYVGQDLGLDAIASQTQGKIVGLRAEGPAARAGIREGESMVSLVAIGGVREPVEVTLVRDGQAVVVGYRAIGHSGRGEAWKRRAGADDRECPR